MNAVQFNGGRLTRRAIGRRSRQGRPQDLAAAQVRLTRDGTTARLGFEPDWSDGHPRTRHLLDEEMAMWGRGGPLRLELQR